MITWRRSSRSYSNGQCVEVGRVPDGVAVRDSKNPGRAPLQLGRDGWAVVVRTIKAGGR